MALARSPALRRRSGNHTGRIERLDPPNSADPIFKVRPKRLHLIADGRDGAQASNDNSAIVHKKSDE